MRIPSRGEGRWLRVELRWTCTDADGSSQVRPIEGRIRRRIGIPELRRASGWHSDLALTGEEDSDWDWSSLWSGFLESQRLGVGKYIGFSLWALGDLQGLMIVDVEGVRRNRVTDGMPQLYVENLAVAPANRSSIRSPRQLEGCGGALLKVAVRESYRQGWQGRVALHSLSGALGFYLSQGFRDLGPDPHECGYHYLERSGTIQA